MPLAVSILASITGVGSTVVMLVMLLAGSPNSTPQQLAEIKAWMLAATLIGVGCLAASVWAMVAGRPWIAATIGVAPLVADAIIFIYLLVAQR